MEEHHHHSHSHAPGHVHAPKDFGLAFAVGTTLNILLVILQVVFGIIGNSMALLADAAHNLTDVLGLLMAWGATIMARRPPTARYTYGLRSSSILAALANAIVLLLAVGAISWEAIHRFLAPEPVAEKTVMIVAALGILINGATALMFISGRKGDLNIQGAFLHMAADAGISLGVLVSALIVLITGWLWLDPLVSLVISMVIVWGTWGLLRDAVNLALNAVPASIDPVEVQSYLRELPGVDSIHDLHIWAMSTTETALTCHLVMPAGHPSDPYIAGVAKQLHDRFGIAHSTLQVECVGEACVLAPPEVV